MRDTAGLIVAALTLAASATLVPPAALVAPAAGRDAAAPAAPTRADLEALRRRLALLEGELALARSRKPYLILDAPRSQLRIALQGLTVREIPLASIQFDGMLPETGGGPPAAAELAGIATLAEKESDPRLKPLTPADVEAGAADENVADALPPEAPADYELRFKQPVMARIEGLAQNRTFWSRLAAWWRRPGYSAGTGGPAQLRVIVRMDELPAREIYRTLLPGERLVFVPPAGFVLPGFGQEPPRSIKPARPAAAPAPPKGPAPEGVPFRIPPPVENTGDTAQQEGGEATPGSGPQSPGGAAGPGANGVSPPGAGSPNAGPPDAGPSDPGPPGVRAAPTPSAAESPTPGA